MDEYSTRTTDIVIYPACLQMANNSYFDMSEDMMEDSTMEMWITIIIFKRRFIWNVKWWLIFNTDRFTVINEFLINLLPRDVSRLIIRNITLPTF